MRLIRIVFEQLLSDLLNKFREDTIAAGLNLPTQKGKLYGYDYRRPTQEPNLIDAINNDKKVQAYFQKRVKLQEGHKVPRKHLYNLERDFSAGGQPNKFDEAATKETYLDTYTVYLGYPSFKEYVNQHKGFDSQAVATQQVRLRSLPEELTQHATTYTGYYYSYREYKIKTVELLIDFVNGANNHYPAKLNGLHDEDGAKQDIRYIGFASRKATDYLMIDLEGANGYPLTMLGHIGGRAISDCEIIYTSMQGVSVNAYPISIEIVLLKQKMEGSSLSSVAKGNLKNLYLYLQLQRRTYRVPNRMNSSLSSLKARRNDLRRFTSRLKGNYRLWNYSRKGNIIQSRFRIEDNFCAYLETIPKYINEQKQVCMMSISNARDSKLCVAAHEEIGIGIINYFILDIENTNTTGVMDGVFASIGPKDLGVLADYLVAVKDDSEFETCEMKRSEIVPYLKAHPVAIPLKDRLYKLCKEKRSGITFID